MNVSLDLNRCWTEASVVQNDIRKNCLHNLNQKILKINSQEIILVVVNHWNKIPRILVHSPLLDIFEYRLDVSLEKVGKSSWVQY